LPALFLLRTIYRADGVEKEPTGLLLKLVVWGVVSTIPAVWLERLGTAVLDRVLTPGSTAHTIALAFLVVAVVEEGMKFLLLKWRSWHHPAFNYRFDGVVYAVFVSLGFAAYENILYVFNYGLSVALPRALLAVPGHMSFAVAMGIYYGRAKCYWRRGHDAAAKFNLILGYLLAVFLHGFYDACAMIGTGLAMLLFIVFVVLMLLFVFRSLKRESTHDLPI
jgi:RsiW-degrading membrane proteinase PrsW (M82 family)